MSFYDGTTMKTQGAYKYNAFKILNTDPYYLTGSESTADKRTRLSENVDSLILSLSNQLSQRQVHCLEEMGSMFSSSAKFSTSELMGIHEFRFEGAGCYRSGIDDDGRNTSRVSRVSIDFRNLNGEHNDGQPSDFNDGYGLYGAMAVVVRKAEIVAIFFRASTLPDEMDKDATLAEGIYSFKVGTHPISGGYKALNLYKLNNFSSSGRNLPAVIDNMNDDGIISGVNSHMGHNTERGSEGCPTITKANDDYDDYIALFNSAETGKFVLERKCNLPNV